VRGKRVTSHVYIAEAYLNLLRGLEISSILNLLILQVIDSIILLPIITHLTYF
jgi:hypothetical protein